MDFINNKFFKNNNDIKIEDYKSLYYLSKYVDNVGIKTIQIQKLINQISDNGGGLLIIDDIYYTGALYFKNNVSLYINDNGKIIASANISDYPLEYTRIEGESTLYYPAVLNFIGVNNINIFGSGVIDGNGYDSWVGFWNRLEWNPNGTNKDEQRPRLIFISNSNNINIFGLTLINSPFWNIHLYKSEYIKLYNLKIYTPKEPIKAPSTDGIDIDYSKYILIKNNYFDVNDDAISLKGGKGTYADTDFHNGKNEFILIENNKFNFCHSCLTLGSESIHTKDVIFKDNISYDSNNILWIKMRPDTPQIYENILIKNVSGYSRALIYIKPWTQYNNPIKRLDMKKNIVSNVNFENIKLECDYFFKISKSDQYILKDFKFKDIDIKCLISGYNPNKIDNILIDNVKIKEEYEGLRGTYLYVKDKLENEHIKIISKMKNKMISISNQYPGVWLEHLYDSIIYGDLFNDYSIAKNTLNNFLSLQNENGQIPCFIKEDGSVGYSQIQECVSFIRLGLIIFNKTNDYKLLNNLYEKGQKYVDFIYKYRMNNNFGLVEMFVGYDSGHDNSPRLDNLKYKGYYSIHNKRINASERPDDKPIYALDLSSNLYMNLISLRDIAIILNDSSKIQYFDSLARQIKNNIFKYLFDEKELFFFDRDDNGLIKHYSSTIFHLFMERVLDIKEDKELIDKIYKLHIKNENEFWTNYPFPSIALNDESRTDHKMPNSWGYYSQALIALRCNLWMDYYGHESDYNKILYSWLDGFMKNYNTYPFAQELDPETGISSGASTWYSSSMLLFLFAVKRLKLIE